MKKRCPRPMSVFGHVFSDLGSISAPFWSPKPDPGASFSRPFWGTEKKGLKTCPRGTRGTRGLSLSVPKKEGGRWKMGEGRGKMVEFGGVWCVWYVVCGVWCVVWCVVTERGAWPQSRQTCSEARWRIYKKYICVCKLFDVCVWTIQYCK